MSNLNKGLNGKLSQDFYRAVELNNGSIQFNRVKIVNVSLVVIGVEEPKILVCCNPSDERVQKDSEVLIKDGNGYLPGTVLVSFKLLKKYYKDIRSAFGQKDNCEISMVKVNDVFENVYVE